MGRRHARRRYERTQGEQARSAFPCPWGMEGRKRAHLPDAQMDGALRGSSPHAQAGRARQPSPPGRMPACPSSNEASARSPVLARASARKSSHRRERRMRLLLRRSTRPRNLVRTISAYPRFIADGGYEQDVLLYPPLVPKTGSRAAQE